jgi:hypothetical protein
VSADSEHVEWHRAAGSGDKGGGQTAMAGSSGYGVGLRSVDGMASGIVRIPHDPGLWWIVVIAHHNEIEGINA